MINSKNRELAFQQSVKFVKKLTTHLGNGIVIKGGFMFCYKMQKTAKVFKNDVTYNVRFLNIKTEMIS